MIKGYGSDLQPFSPLNAKKSAKHPAVMLIKMTTVSNSLPVSLLCRIIINVKTLDEVLFSGLFSVSYMLYHDTLSFWSALAQHPF